MPPALLESTGLWPCEIDSEHAGLDLSLQASDVVAVAGDSEQSVAEWLRCLAGLSEPCRGRLLFSGRRVDELDKQAWQTLRTQVAYLHKGSRLMSVQSLLNNVILPAFYHGMGQRDELLARAKNMLTELGVTDETCFDRLPAFIDDYSYSAALIARVMLMHPKVLVMDDFLRMYSKQQAQYLMNCVMKSVRQQGMAAIIHNHDLAPLKSASVTALYLGDVRWQRFGSVEQLCRSNDPQLNQLLHNRYLS